MTVFRKTAAEADLERFEAEAEGLAAIQATGTIRVPEVVALGVRDGVAYIEMERLHLESPDAATEERFGESLAAMHRNTGPAFGWTDDNWCGPTLQKNTFDDDWIRFFGEQRLGYQLDLAASNGFTFDNASRVRDRLGRLFEGYQPEASLLHGDLWSGNRGVVDGESVIFDPAIHYGDRECDLAMTHLFGGFSATFYAAYVNAWPLADGAEHRRTLYQLYHVLNHVNIFGGGYARQADSQLRELARVV